MIKLKSKPPAPKKQPDLRVWSNNKVLLKRGGLLFEIFTDDFSDQLFSSVTILSFVARKTLVRLKYFYRIMHYVYVSNIKKFVLMNFVLYP